MSIFSNILKKVLVVPTIVDRVNNPGTATKTSAVANAILDPLNLFKKNKADIDAANAAKKAASSNVAAAASNVIDLFGFQISQTLLFAIGALLALLVGLYYIFKKRR